MEEKETLDVSILPYETFKSRDGTVMKTIFSVVSYDPIERDYLLCGSNISRDSYIFETFDSSKMTWGAYKVEVPVERIAQFHKFYVDKVTGGKLLLFFGYWDYKHPSYGPQHPDNQARTHSLVIYNFDEEMWTDIKDEKLTKFLNFCSHGIVESTSSKSYYCFFGEESSNFSTTEQQFLSLFDIEERKWIVNSSPYRINGTDRFVYSTTIVGHFIYCLIGPSNTFQWSTSKEERRKATTRKVSRMKLERMNIFTRDRWEVVEEHPSKYLHQYKCSPRTLSTNNFIVYFYGFEDNKEKEEDDKVARIVFYNTDKNSWRKYVVKLDDFLGFRPNDPIIAGNKICLIGGVVRDWESTWRSPVRTGSEILQIDISKVIRTDEKQDLDLRVRFMESYGEKCDEIRKLLVFLGRNGKKLETPVVLVV